MIDATALADAKRRFDFLREVPGLRRHAQTSGGEWHGPCPSCGGVDRFVAWPAHPDGPRAWCRQCHETPMDPLAFLQWRDGVDFVTACRRLGLAPVPPRVVATYDYRTAEGQLLYQVLRYDPKDFRQRRPRTLTPRPGVETDWIWNLKDTPRVLYRLPQLAAAPMDAVVWLHEGEKDVDATVAQGGTATTNAGGAASWRPEYAAALRDRFVCVVPDADADGAKWAQAVVSSLAGVARRVKVVALPPGCKDVSDFYAAGHSLSDLEALAAAAPVVDRAPDPPAPAGRFRVLDDAASDALPPPAWLVDELLIAGAVNLIYGPGGSGKSVLTIDLACTLAAGLPAWYGRATAPGPVVYIAAEAPEEVAQRKRAWKADRGIPALPGFFLVPERVPLLDPEAVPGLLASLPPAAARPALIVIDTLSRTMRGGDENSGQDMGRVFEAAELLRDRTGATICIIHHSGKDVSRGARGSSSLTFDARQALSVSKQDAIVSVETEKHNNSGEQAPFRFVFRAVPDPADPDATTVVLGLAAPDGADLGGPLAPMHRLVLDILGGPVFTGEASSAELNGVEELHNRGVHRALSALITRGLVRTPNPPGTRGRRFFVTAAGWATLGRADRALTLADAPITAPPRLNPVTNTSLTPPADPITNTPDPAPTPNANITNTSLTVINTSLTLPAPLTNTRDSSSIELSRVLVSAGVGDGPPTWQAPPDPAPPRPLTCPRGHHQVSQRWDAATVRWRCASCWEIHRE